MKIIKEILHKIVAHDYKFIAENQNPVEMTRKMYRIAKRYDCLRTVYDKMCEKGYVGPTKRTEKRLTINKFFYLLNVKHYGKKYNGPATIIGTHINKNWEKQGMSNQWEFKNTGINRVLNHQNFF